MVLRQQQHARQRAFVLAQPFQRDFRAQNGLHALAPRGLVELDGAEHVVQVRHRQRGLGASGCQLHGLVDAQGAVHHGKLGMQAKVDKRLGRHG